MSWRCPYCRDEIKVVVNDNDGTLLAVDPDPVPGAALHLVTAPTGERHAINAQHTPSLFDGEDDGRRYRAHRCRLVVTS